MVCDSFLRSSDPNVYVARWYNSQFDRSMRVEHWSAAAEQGARAARNAVWPDTTERYATVTYFWSDRYGSRIQFVGLAGEEHEVVSGDLDGEHFVAVYREGDRLSGALTLNRQRHIMKYRRLIAQGATFDAAPEFARTGPVRPLRPVR